MIAMQAYWILPNRSQLDDLLASDGAKVTPLRQILDPKLRPEGFSHGVPAELLEKCAPDRRDQILFAQKFPDWNGGKQLFSVSMPAGVDSAGRVVHLGILLVLGSGERPAFDLSYAGLSQEDQGYARTMIRRLGSRGRADSWARSVWELSDSRGGPATNVELERSVVPFRSLYAIGSAGLTRKSAARRRLQLTSLILLILLGAVGVSLCERACGHASRPLARTGAVTCRFS